MFTITDDDRLAPDELYEAIAHLRSAALTAPDDQRDDRIADIDDLLDLLNRSWNPTD